MFNVVKFGANIARLRKSADMTQSELADKINITRQAVSKYECGDRFPDISILLLIAEIFNISVEGLIKAGEPTKIESEILLYQNASNDVSVDEIINIAPFIKPSVLDRFMDNLKKQGIDVVHLVALAEYMNAKSITELMENTNVDTIDKELLKRLIPVLSEDSKNAIFEKILDGKMDWQYIEILIPFAGYLVPYIEAAVIEGVLPHCALKMMKEALRNDK